MFDKDSTIDVGRTRAALALGDRLSSIPIAAQVRGLFFKMTSDAVERAGRAEAASYRRLSPRRSRWFFQMYSVREYVEDLAAAAAVLSPQDPASAIRSIWATTYRYAPLFNAQRFMALLRTDIVGVAAWLENHRGFFANYGSWRLERRSSDYFVMHYFDEWIWIESAHRGGMEGLLEASGLHGTVTADLETPYTGRLHVRWQAR